MVGALHQLQEGEDDAPEVEKSFLLDKRLIAQELIDSPLALASFVDLEELTEDEDIELNSLEGSEPPIQFYCSDYSIGISIPYWEQTGQWQEGLMSLWSVVLNICERNHLVFYDSQLDCEASMESFEATMHHFAKTSEQLKQIIGASDQPARSSENPSGKALRPWWKIWG